MTRWFRDLKNSASQVEITFLNASRDCDNLNDDSVVTLVGYKGRKLLVTGDAQWKAANETCKPPIERMLERISKLLLDVDFYKVGHHGADNGTNEKFLKAMTPQISFISAGDKTDTKTVDYGHPRKNIVEELLQYSSGKRKSVMEDVFEKANGKPTEMNVSKAVYCTCWDGDITISISSSGKISMPKTTN